MERNKPVNRRYPAAVKFIRNILTNIENAEWADSNGLVSPLNRDTVFDENERAFQAGVMGRPVESWRDLVNPTWLASAATQFEELDTEEAEAEDFSDPLENSSDAG